MCTFHSDREVQVCDIAIGQVKAKLAADLGDVVRYTHLEGGGTLIQADHAVDTDRFRRLVHAGMVEAEPVIRPGG